MKKLIALVVAFISVTPFFFVNADDSVQRDDEGYPLVYLRGDFCGWSYVGEYQFQREGNTYSIELEALDGRFKVADTAWGQIDLGSDSNNYIIWESCTTVATMRGINFYASNLRGVKISFTVDGPYETMWEANLNFEIESGDYMPYPEPEPAPDPEPEPDPTPTPQPDPEPTDYMNLLSHTLPVIYINVYQVDENGERIIDSEGNPIYDNWIISKDLDHKNYFKGEYWLDIADCPWIKAEGGKAIGSAEEPLPLEIKGRGNWTFRGFSKKPFKIKLGKKQNLLGLTPDKSKHYALLAHADDNLGFMRNFVGFNLGKRIGLPWTPSMQPVEVVINGNYRGMYFLTESIRVGDGRVPIEELKDNETSPELASGGYLVELDNYNEPDENQIRMPELGCDPNHPNYYLDMLRVTFDTPEEYSDIQRRFISEQFTTMNELVGQCSDNLWSYIDLDDLVRYYIVREVISDTESFHGSTYLFRDRGANQKWHFSPLWDCGNAFNGYVDMYFYECDPFGNTWIPSMRLNDMFNLKLLQTWAWFTTNCLENIEDDIDTYVNHIRKGAVADAQRWDNQPIPANGAYVANNSDIESRRGTVLYRLYSKIDWLKSQWGYVIETAPEPERDTTPAALLPDYLESASICIPVIDDYDVPAEYFDLFGRRITNPAHGSLYIERRGSSVSKIAF